MVKLSPVCQTNLASQVKNPTSSWDTWGWYGGDVERRRKERRLTGRTGPDKDSAEDTEMSPAGRLRHFEWTPHSFISQPNLLEGQSQGVMWLTSGASCFCLEVHEHAFSFLPGGSSILLPHWSEEPHTTWPTYISSVRLKVTEKTSRLSANNSSSPVKSILLNKQNTPWSLVK